METPPNVMESLFEQLSTYSQTTYNLSKLRALETTTIVAASVVARLSVLLILSLLVFILSIGVALWLGAHYGKLYYGFFIVAIFYLVLGLFLQIFLHRWIKRPVSDFLINKMFQEPQNVQNQFDA